MKGIGVLASILGVLIGIYAFKMDVYVNINNSGSNSYSFPDRVSNLGLLSQRQNLITTSGFVLLFGLLMILLRKKSNVNSINKYKVFPEQAKEKNIKGILL